MRVKILENRRVILEKDNDAGTQFENFATTLQFEFPEYVNKNGNDIAVNTLNKYIVFDIGVNNSDLIIDNTYSLPYAITKIGKITAYIQFKESSNNDDMSDKLIWISDGFLLTFDKSVEVNEVITKEKLDAFNTLYSELNEKIEEVNELKTYFDEFKNEINSVNILIAGRNNGEEDEG